MEIINNNNALKLTSCLSPLIIPVCLMNVYFFPRLYARHVNEIKVND